MLKLLSATLVALVIGMVAGPRFIRWLGRRGIGQNVRECGPESHTAKQGTPTMGGALILVAAVIPYAIFATKTVPSLVVLILAVGSGLIGFTDDLLKQWRQRSLGLNAKAKLLLQVPLCAVGSVPGGSVRGARHPVERALHARGPGHRLGLLPLRLSSDRGVLSRGEPHRRTRRTRLGHRWHRAVRLCGHRVSAGRQRPGHVRGLSHRRLRRLSLVQLASRGGLHGRHGVAGASARP